LYGNFDGELSHTNQDALAVKRTEIKRTPLAETVLRSLEPESKLYRVRDGDNLLYFTVDSKGAKRWEVRFKAPDGRWSWMGVGGYPAVGAKLARREADAIQGLVSEGLDPRKVRQARNEARKAALQHPFSESAEYWYDRKLANGYAKSTAKQMRGYLDNDILPVLGSLPIKEITPKNCADLQQKIEKNGTLDKSSKIRNALAQICRYAVARGLCESNPAAELRYIAETPDAKTPYPHLLEEELPDFLRALDLSTGRKPTIIAMRMVLLTASRPGMVVKTQWAHVDLELALWTVPAGHMKARRPHVVPLPTQLVDMLKELRDMTGRSRYLFPSIGPKHPTMSTDSLNKLLRSIGYKRRLTGHGSRHTASTLLHEHGWNHYHIEAQLSHKMAGVAGTYNQATYLEPRRIMLQWYADYLEALKDGMSQEQEATFRKRAANAMLRNQPEDHPRPVEVA
jgi:integrase